MYYATDYISPLGRVKLAADGEALIGLWLEGQKYFGGKVKEEFVENRSLPVLENAKDWLNRYFAGKKPEISELPIAPMGSAFQRGVWTHTPSVTMIATGLRASRFRSRSSI